MRFMLIAMRDSLKNIWDHGRKWFPLARKSVSTSKNKFNSKNSSLMTSVFASRKNYSNKVTCSTREKNPSPIAGMKGSFKNTFPLDRKKKLSPAVVPKNI